MGVATPQAGGHRSNGRATRRWLAVPAAEVMGHGLAQTRLARLDPYPHVAGVVAGSAQIIPLPLGRGRGARATRVRDGPPPPAQPARKRCTRSHVAEGCCRHSVNAHPPQAPIHALNLSLRGVDAPHGNNRPAAGAPGRCLSASKQGPPQRHRGTEITVRAGSNRAPAADPPTGPVPDQVSGCTGLMQRRARAAPARQPGPPRPPSAAIRPAQAASRI